MVLFLIYCGLAHSYTGAMFGYVLMHELACLGMSVPIQLEIACYKVATYFVYKNRYCSVN
jgi:hypothetical protein